VFHGELTFGTISKFNQDDVAADYVNAYTDITIWPFDYTAVLIELAAPGDYEDVSGVAPTDNVWTVPYFQVTTYIGRALGTPYDFSFTAGKTSLYTRKYEVTGHAYERTKIRSDIDPLVYKGEWDFGMGDLTVAFSNAQGFVVEGGEGNDLGVVIVLPDVLMADWEYFYVAEDNKDFKGILGVDVIVAGVIPYTDVAGGFAYNLVDDSGGPGENYWCWGAGCLIAYGGAELGASINGDNVDTVHQLGFDLNYGFGGYYGIDLALGLSLADGDDTYQGFEGSVYAEGNATTIRIGYVHTENAYAYASAAAALEGGFFITFDVDW
jgi:hypothetical protein